jgi:hypothetical protein
MQWSKMTRPQQTTARKVTEKLWAAGVTGATTSQVARHFDEATDWANGTITLDALCEAAGWTIPAPEVEQASPPEVTSEPAAQDSTEPDLTSAVDAVKAANDRLVAAMVAAKKAGTSVNKIAEMVKGTPGYSRSVVLELLGSEDIREQAVAALEDGGWKIGEGGDVHVYTDRRRVMIELLDDVESDTPANSVTRLNWASGVGSALGQHGLTLWSDDHPIDSWEALATEPVEIVRRAS